MRQFTLLVFDDHVQADAGGLFTYTNQELSQRLGQYDVLSLHAIIDNISGSGGTMTIFPQHSGDGRNWMDKGGNGGTGTAILNSGALTAGTPVQREGFELGDEPAFGLVRLRISLTGGSTTSAHLKLYVTARERR